MVMGSIPSGCSSVLGLPTAGVSPMGLRSSVFRWLGRPAAAGIELVEEVGEKRAVNVDESGGQYEEGFEDLQETCRDHRSLLASEGISCSQEPNYAYLSVIISVAFCAEIIDAEHFLKILGTENLIINGMRRNLNMRAELLSEQR
ncbi:hypothetical protein M5K25_008785 [Dendrobium thyrsiflorum]|uniref:Uncharacterized protein n=1 Tax=Dendrobium thyrsiflorum TaxID=117978 RepID=A0ABD0VGG2_DENTH